MHVSHWHFNGNHNTKVSNLQSLAKTRPTPFLKWGSHSFSSAKWISFYEMNFSFLEKRYCYHYTDANSASLSFQCGVLFCAILCCCYCLCWCKCSEFIHELLQTETYFKKKRSMSKKENILRLLYVFGKFLRERSRSLSYIHKGITQSDIPIVFRAVNTMLKQKYRYTMHTAHTKISRNARTHT